MNNTGDIGGSRVPSQNSPKPEDLPQLLGFVLAILYILPDLPCSVKLKDPVRINELVRLELLKKKLLFSSLTLSVSFFCAI